MNALLTIRHIILYGALLIPALCLGQDIASDTADLNKYSIDILFSHSGDFFDAYESSDDINPIGSFYGNEQNSLAFTFSFPYHYFHNSNAGYYVNYNIKHFDFNKQDTSITSTGINEVNLGTSVSGYNVYAFTSFFYNFGDRFIVTDDNKSLKLGIGIGLGYLKADGDIILTEQSGSPLVDINISDVGLAFGLYIDYRYGPWVFRLEGFSTEARQDSIHFEYMTIPLQIGYSYRY